MNFIYAVLVLFVPHVVNVLFPDYTSHFLLIFLGSVGISSYFMYSYLQEKLPDTVGNLVTGLLSWYVSVRYTVSMFEISRDNKLLDVPTEVIEGVQLRVVELCGIIINTFIWFTLVFNV